LVNYHIEGVLLTCGKARDLTKELEVAVEAAKAAGEVLRSGFGRPQSVEYKGQVDLLTEADQRAQHNIEEVLKEAFPDYAILAEEGEGTPAEGDPRWIVDPLDGTTNYAHGLAIFSVSVALERGGEVLLGVVHDPMGQETYAARGGGGATLNGRGIRVSDTDEPIRALLATSFSDEREYVPVGLDLFGRFARLVRGVRRLGSAALDMCYVAAGRLDGCYEHGFSVWDVAAGVLILEEAGGKATDYRGRELDLEGGEVVASNGLLHPALIDVTSG
jgi:myo-inositol-1(or 4)-monophosphatase